MSFSALLPLMLAAAADSSTGKRPAADPVIRAAPDTAVVVTFGGFVDVYGAYDFGRPRSLDRAFTTQAARHNEFNVNLAFIEAAVAGPRVRGRVALQTGTSVQVNYAGEPRVGTVSGPELSRLIQEAYVGYALHPSLWIDAGVFYSNVGMEGWVSRDNPIYTRSLVADYSPYYSSGVRAVWQAGKRVTVRGDLVNGWQTISEANAGKTLGARVDVALTSRTSVSWYGLAGREVESRVRLYNGVGLKSQLSKRLDITAEVDAGREDAPDSLGTGTPARTWYGAMSIVRWTLSDRSALVARVERYADRHQVVATTGTANPLRASGASVGMDVHPAPRLLWRAEARLLRNASPVFPDRRAQGERSRQNAVLVSSMALTF